MLDTLWVTMFWIRYDKLLGYIYMVIKHSANKS